MEGGTRTSLIERVRDLEDESGWEQFDAIYRPLLIQYARCRGLDADTAEEIAQECFEVIVRHIRGFRRRRSFRAWLRRMVDNKVKRHVAMRQREHPAGSGVLSQLSGAERSPREAWEYEWNRMHLLYCLARLRDDFASHTLEAFELYVLREMPVPRIGTALNMTPNQIYVAKSRVIRRLKERYASMMRSLYTI